MMLKLRSLSCPLYTMCTTLSILVTTQWIYSSLLLSFLYWGSSGGHSTPEAQLQVVERNNHFPLCSGCAFANVAYSVVDLNDKVDTQPTWSIFQPGPSNPLLQSCSTDGKFPVCESEDVSPEKTFLFFRCTS